ncbi:hypothetical protein V6Z11_A02G065700 [Gossypium hirsutum]
MSVPQMIPGTTREIIPNSRNTRILRRRVGSHGGHVKRRRFGIKGADQNDVVLIGYLRQNFFKQIHFFILFSKNISSLSHFSLPAQKPARSRPSSAVSSAALATIHGVRKSPEGTSGAVAQWRCLQEM